MGAPRSVVIYSEQEENLNVLSHFIGFLLSLAAIPLLVARAALYGNIWHLVSFSIFGISLAILYAASTFYHREKKERSRLHLQVFDHASIYVLIAGSYTPFALVTLNGVWGWVIFGLSWGFAVVGITLKIFFTGRYDKLSTSMYVLMGWIIVIAMHKLIENFSAEGIFWLFAGGVAYTVGAVIYSIKKIPFNHAIFHFFVLAGSICHFVAVFFYVLPAR